MSNAEPAQLIGDLSAKEFKRRLNEEGLGLRIGPFDAHLQIRVNNLYESLYRLYRDFPVLNNNRVFSFHAALEETRSWPLMGRNMVRFTVDGRAPHEDMPAGQALAVLEWGINLVIAMRSHCFIMLHAAVLEKNGHALLLPAEPGNGKTTLCTALAHHGWRLFSDEFGLVRPGSLEFIPVPRLMPLKNESTAVIRAFSPDAELGPLIPGTRKGDITHVKPSAESIRNADITAPAKWMVFPRWTKDAPLQFDSLPKAHGYMMLASNSFNYELLGEQAFQTLKIISEQSQCFRLEYSDLDAALAALDRMAES